MIDFQSSFSVGKACSPEGWGRLAGDNIPGHQPNDPCALKGRWREPISFVGSPALIEAERAVPLGHSVILSNLCASACHVLRGGRIRVYQPVRRSLGEGGCLPRRSLAKAGPFVVKSFVSEPKILNPFQTPPKLSKPFQGPWEGGGVELSTQNNPFKPF